jgi:hypothetical protein
MRCGHGWEQSYEIEHHVDGAGQEFIVYKAGGERVPSPLSSPKCLNCGGHVVRIMRAGQVSSVLGLTSNPEGTPFPPAGPVSAGGGWTSPRPPALPRSEAGKQAEGHRWHLSDLLHPFHHRK